MQYEGQHDGVREAYRLQQNQARQAHSNPGLRPSRCPKLHSLLWDQLIVRLICFTADLLQTSSAHKVLCILLRGTRARFHPQTFGSVAFAEFYFGGTNFNLGDQLTKMMTRLLPALILSFAAGGFRSLDQADGSGSDITACNRSTPSDYVVQQSDNEQNACNQTMDCLGSFGAACGGRFEKDCKNYLRHETHLKESSQGGVPHFLFFFYLNSLNQ